MDLPANWDKLEAEYLSAPDDDYLCEDCEKEPCICEEDEDEY